jgi:hypothetical protein
VTAAQAHPAWCYWLDCKAYADGFEQVHRGRPIMIPDPANRSKVVLWLEAAEGQVPAIDLILVDDFVTAPYWRVDAHHALVFELDTAAAVGHVIASLVRVGRSP